MDMGSANMKKGPGYFSDMGWKANGKTIFYVFIQSNTIHLALQLLIN